MSLHLHVADYLTRRLTNNFLPVLLDSQAAAFFLAKDKS